MAKYATSLLAVVKEAQIQAIDEAYAYVIDKSTTPLDEAHVKFIKEALDEFKNSIAVTKTKTKRKFTPNGYTHFSKESRAKVVADNPGVKTTEVMKLLGAAWKALTPEERDGWRLNAVQAQSQAQA